MLAFLFVRLIFASMADAATWTQVADTAVKIGLSGLIAVIGGYMLSKRGQKHEFDRDYLKARQDVIRDVSTRFARIHRLFFDISIKYQSLVDYVSSGLPVSQETQDEYYKYIRDIGEALHEMHILEADLLLVGTEKATALLTNYRLQATEVNDMLRLEKPTKSKEEVQAITQELFNRRERFYHALSNAFKRI
jgi:hypothetical protein